MNSDEDTPCGVGCPIRRSRDRRSLASPPGFSQRATSFLASQCQGIHQMPFSLRLLAQATPPAHRGKTRSRVSGNGVPAKAGAHMRQATSHEDTSLGHAQSNLSARRVRLGHMTNSRFTLQSTTPTPSRGPAIACFSKRRTPPPARGGRGASRRSAAAPVGRQSQGFAGGGGERTRTDDLLLAKQALSQLSYTPFQGSEDRACPGESRGIRDQNC
jgi:hypothetical protein